ncbi:hypothetical protein SAMN05421788_101530 [Filimonas lacunae]|uniref:Lysozyme inhibitor LprI N-terminal domain-containing protein n=1 Tax=Filimonas lacunae TaxID=477680 RepID=A0A173MN66_9BACT|nr:hypothetical protein [Filimonas lacunae]BAV09082.1 hypothetical protein FLA_5130 [Filimonas lacunae]SIS67052.1 hypothetical protein SAMN05421788_101530 [Filimonas lacunae]
MPFTFLRFTVFVCVLAGILIVGNQACAQAPGNIKDYLTNKEIPKVIIDYYNGKLKPADELNILAALDSMSSRNAELRPFYMLVVSKMVEKSISAWKDDLGKGCKEFMEQRPDYLIEFLNAQSPLLPPGCADKWMNKIADEIKRTCEGREKDCLSRSYQSAWTRCRASNKATLSVLYKKIEAGL